MDADGYVLDLDPKRATKPLAVRKRPCVNSASDVEEVVKTPPGKGPVEARNIATKRLKMKKHLAHKDGGDDIDETSDAELGMFLEIIH